MDTVTFYTQTQDPVTGIWDGVWVAVGTPPTSMNDRTEWSINPVVPPAPPAGVIADSQVDFVIPNGKPVMITYQVRVTLPPGEAGTISNEVRIFGETAEDGNNNFVVDGGGIGVGGDKVNLRVFKADQAGNNLPGATFSLYVTDIGGGLFVPPGGLPVAKTVMGAGGETIEFALVEVAGPSPPALVDSVTTDSTGIALFSDSEWLTSDASFDLLYLLVETGVPAGYTVANENTFFVLNPVIDSVTLDGLKALLDSEIGDSQVDRATDFVRVENTALGAMTVQKVFELPEDITDLLLRENLGDFELVITGPESLETTLGIQAILDNPGGILIEDLVPGTYTIAERSAEIASLVLTTDPPLPYTYEVEPASTGAVAIVITNTYTLEPPPPVPVDLRLTKSIEGLSDAQIREHLQDIQIVVDGPGRSSDRIFTLQDILAGPLVIENADPGRYEISERNAEVDGFSLVTSPTLPHAFELLPNDAGYVEIALYNIYTPRPPGDNNPGDDNLPGDSPGSSDSSRNPGRGPITGDWLQGINLIILLLAALTVAISARELHKDKAKGAQDEGD